jgi:glycosyltransferase involved in cell wall biosynthesis
VLPLVSCLTPTCNRRAFFPQAVECFLSQDYPSLEWVILDDGTDSIEDLLPKDPRIKYFRGSKANHGDKMNSCCEIASAEFLVVWDDDDEYPPDRITRQIQPMLENPLIEMTGTSTLYYQDGQNAYQYTSPDNVAWLASIAFRRESWLCHKFESLPSGADYVFQQKIRKEARLDLFDPRLVVASIHDSNACKKNISLDYVPVPWGTIENLLNHANLDSNNFLP